MNPTQHEEERPRRHGRRVARLLISTALVGMLLGLAVAAVRAVREAARMSQCANNLKQIGLALHNYRDANGSFPPASLRHIGAQSQPAHSWRVLVSPYVMASPFYAMYRRDEPWFSADNLKLSRLIEFIYHCPSDRSPTHMTSYLAVVGPGTAWPSHQPSRPEAFAGGVSNTILLVECADSGIHWMEPRDLEADKLDFAVRSRSRYGFSGTAHDAGPGLSSEHWHGMNAVFADGSVRFLPADANPDVVRGLLTIRDDKSTARGE